MRIKLNSYLFVTFIIIFNSCNKEKEAVAIKQPFAIVLHGGAGTILKKNMSPEQEKTYHAVLEKAINTGYSIIESGGSSLKAVQKTINILEDSPLFNAGKGAVFDSQGKNKMDASIMDGKTLNTGAVAGVSNIKNPINAARMVMDSTKHVLLSGKGAEIFAQQHQIKFESDKYFYTERAYNSWKNVRDREKNKQYSVISKQYSVNNSQLAVIQNSKFKIQNLETTNHFGTVGVVALDKNGNIAAGTSTGGLTYKKYGRIGDSPIIGAGTYANNNTCGVSCTGIGEYYIRTLAAKEISSLIEYKKLTAKEAAKEVIHNQIAKLGGLGGIIVLDKNGNIAWDFNTKGMYRAYRKSNGDKKIEFFEMIKDSI